MDIDDLTTPERSSPTDWATAATLWTDGEDVNSNQVMALLKIRLKNSSILTTLHPEWVDDALPLSEEQGMGRLGGREFLAVPILKDDHYTGYWYSHTSKELVHFGGRARTQEQATLRWRLFIPKDYVDVSASVVANIPRQKSRECGPRLVAFFWILWTKVVVNGTRLRDVRITRAEFEETVTTAIQAIPKESTHAQNPVYQVMQP